MNKYFLSILLTSLLISAKSFAYQQPQGIEVSGKAAVEAVPDRFSLSFSIVTRGKSASKTKALVDHKTTLVVNAAKKMGIKATDIQSARMNLRPIYQKQPVKYSDIEINKKFPHNEKGRIHVNKNKDKNKLQQAYVFEVSRQIKVNIANIEDYDRLLDQIIKIGVTNISPLSMSVGQADIYYQKALMMAIQIAKEKAMKIAAQAGVELGKLIYLKETSYNAPVNMRMSFNSEASIHQSQAGTKQINAEVFVTFAIEP